jgi:hypothetical protein
VKKLASVLIGFVLCAAGLTAQPQPKPDPKDTGKKAHQTPQVAKKKAVKPKPDTKKGKQTSVQGKKGGSSNQ